MSISSLSVGESDEIVSVCVGVTSGQVTLGNDEADPVVTISAMDGTAVKSMCIHLYL